MADAHYELSELAALYDIDNGWSADRSFYRDLAGKTPCRVLEIGCGTGLIARAMAERGHRVTGVDPAQAMLDTGRNAPFGERIDWVRATAQDFAVDRRFDLAFMTGHAFQVLLTDEDIAQSLTNIRLHLAPGGVFAFESRNPALAWERIFDGAAGLETSDGLVPVEWKVLWRRGDLVRFDTHYHLPDGIRTSESTLRFLSLEQLAAFLQDAGFEIRSVHGDWDRSAFDPANSREIIILAVNPA